MLRQKKILTLATIVGLTVSTVVIGNQLVSGQTPAVETVFVPVTPCRLVDTRPAVAENTGPRSTPIGAGEVAVFNAHDGRDADSTCAIPVSATAVATNVVAVNPTAASFLTLYPAGVDTPGTSNLNFVAGQAPTPNSANVSLGATGGFNVFNRHGTVDVVIDINGYYQRAAIGTAPPVGPAGPRGPIGPRGRPGVDAVAPANVVWVAKSGGDFTTLSAALGSITDASFDKPYVIKIAPGLYTETATVALKGDVDVEGSGEGVTTITCACAAGAAIAASPPSVSSEMRHLTIQNTGGGTTSTAISSNADLSLLHVTAEASGGTTTNVGVSTTWSGTRLDDVGAYARGGTEGFGVRIADASPTLIDVIALASGSSETTAIEIVGGSPKLTNLRIISSGTTRSTGVLVDGGTPTISGGTINVRDASSGNTGVLNLSGAATSIVGTSITASGGSNVFGVFNGSDVAMHGVTITASGGSNFSIAINNDSRTDPATSVIRSSTLTGGLSVLHTGDSPSAMIADTMLDPAPGVQTDLTCVGAYDAAFLELTTGCAVAL